MENSLKLIIFIILASSVAQAKLTCQILFSSQYMIRSPDFKEKPLRERHNLTVVTWNLDRFFVEKPDRSLPQVRQRLPEDTIGIVPKKRREIERYRRVIEDISPDVLVLQEVVGSYTTRALDPKGEYYHEARTSVDPGGLQTVFMIRKSLNVSIKVRSPKAEKDLSTTRGLPVLSLRAKDSNSKVIDPNHPDLIIMGLHLKSKNGMREELYQKVKAKEVKAILKAQKEMAELFLEAPLMIAGDMNIGVKNNSLLNPLKKHFKEAIKLARPEAKKDDRASQVSFAPDGKRVIQQLDAEFLNPALQKRLVDAFIYRYLDSQGNIRTYEHNGEANHFPTTWSERKQGQVSDHFPLVGVYDMTRK